MSKRAIIVVDLQNDYLPTGKMPLVGIDSAMNNAARVIADARAKGEKVIHIRHESASSDAPFFVPGSQGAQIHSSVEPAVGEPVIVKNQINSFLGTDLKQVLDADGTEEVTVVGAMSHMCIDAATRAASDLGYKTTVVHDACATRDLEFDGQIVPAAQVHAALMSALAFGYAKVTTTASYLENR
jgi:nicotinamidase-related amidase